ncbi:O-antigen ligase family protein [Curtobacterium sp. MCSS17_015]|uniref:O-antigen ligase family protein n=1 Tax=Curtobacterium sp. MCSS17_015 TaxID=2175666 RepID=UPI0011B7D545|nr:O-antigen ligase family protein [Curtobacterium sp. MCSS17_015]WIB26925.1 O-antigen ligase family protein [Curtobacterium sp. MCSS17_015]
MIGTVAVLLTACSVAAWLAPRRPGAWLGLGLTGAMLPVGATRSWFEGPLASTPPSTWFLLTGTLVLLCDRRRLLRHGVPTMLAAVTSVAGVGIVTVFLLHGASSSNALLVLWVLPLTGLTALLAASTSPRMTDLVDAMTPWLTALASAEALLAVMQRMVGSAILFDEYRAAANQFTRTGRSNGTFDSPLDLAAFLTLALVIIVRGHQPWRTWLVSVLVVSGIACTGSRTGIVLAVAIVTLGVASRGMRRPIDLVIVLATAVAGIIAAASPVLNSLFERFGERGDRSTWARGLARDTGIRLVEDHPVTGSGLTYAYEYALANLPSSFENAWLSLAIGAGLPVAALFLAVPVAVALLPGRPVLLARAAAVTALVWGFSYSAYTATSTFGLLSWMTVGLAATDLLRRWDPVSRADREKALATTASPEQSPMVTRGVYGAR